VGTIALLSKVFSGEAFYTDKRFSFPFKKC